MQILSVLSVLAAVLFAALAWLNLGELMRPVELNLGWRLVEAPLGLLMLGLAGLAWLLALAAAVGAQMAHASQRRQLEDELQTQRERADSAEGSRFAQLQRHLELQAQAAEHRERETQAQFDRQLERVRQAVQQQLDEVGSSLAAYIGEVEDRLERRRLLRPLEDHKPTYERH